MFPICTSMFKIQHDLEYRFKKKPLNVLKHVKYPKQKVTSDFITEVISILLYF